MIRCDFESHEELYRDGLKALEFAKSIKETAYDAGIDLHFYWRVPREFGRKQLASVKSAIVTQNLRNTRIHLWSNIDLSNNPCVQQIAKHIHLHVFDPVKEAIGTPLEGLDLLKKDDSMCWLGGDLFRLLILYKYGGVYVDCDIILIRDLAPLLEQEFMYQWGTELDRINGAVMRLFKGSQLGNDLLLTLPKVNGSDNTCDWGSHLYGRVRQTNKNWTVFPCAFFNPEWQLYIDLGNADHPFKKSPHSQDDFEGCFSWHWHNKWDAPIEDGSKFQRLEKKVVDTFDRDFSYPVVDKNKRHLGGNISGGDRGTACPSLWQWLTDEFKLTSVFDVGCAEGHALEWFRQKGLKVSGLEGLQQNVDVCLRKGLDVSCVDLTEIGFVLGDAVDLVWCCEVVEHIHEKYLSNLLTTLANGKYVFITHGTPGQSGYNHVNCQEASYWIERLRTVGYVHMEQDSIKARDIATGWVKHSGMLFKRVS